MSKFPNHGLFTRTAAASTRSSSLIAHARRGAPRRRSAALAPSSSLSPSTSSAASSVSAIHAASQASASQPPFIGPLTLAASQSAHPSHASSSSSSSSDLRTELSTSSAQSSQPIAFEPRYTHDLYCDPVEGAAHPIDPNPRTTLHSFDQGAPYTSTLAQIDLALRQASQLNITTALSPSSVAFSAAARHLSRVHVSSFPHPSLDRIPAHRSSTPYSIPNTRAIHVFYPNAAAAHALNPGANPHFESPSSVPSIDGRALSSRRTASKRSKDEARSASDYVPLWNASATTASSAAAPQLAFASSMLPHSSLEQRFDDLALLSSDQSDSTPFGSAVYSVPVALIAGTTYDDIRASSSLANPAALSAQGSPPGSRSSDYASERGQDTLFDTTPLHQRDTADWAHSDQSSSTWHSSSSSNESSESSSSSSSSSSSRSPTPTISARPHLTTSTVQHDSSGSHSSGSSTPTQNHSLSVHQLENALFGPYSVLTAAAHASRSFEQRRSALGPASDNASDAAESAPLWTGSFASPKHRQMHYAFEHGAYGIPKRHPWAAVRGNGKRAQSAPKPAPRTGAVGMLAAAADFLTGSSSATGPPVTKEKLGGESVIAEDGRRLGLNSPIREHGRIVQDRLQSVQVGEDAYFLRPDSIGVADGVGGWASRAGADPALFSRLLMHFCAAELSKFDGLSADELAAQNGKKLREWQDVDPVEVMHTAWERCVRASRREGILGSSTALIAVLRGDELRIANLGDCVLLIIRAGELLFRSTEQQHSFNFPVQLGMMGHTAESVTIAANRTLARDGYLQSGASDDLDDNAPNPLGTTTPASMDEARRHRPSGTPETDEGDEAEEAEWDEPRRDAGRWAVKVQKGDIIIVGSDGLVDNLFDEDIVEEVHKFAPPPASHGTDVDAGVPAANTEDEAEYKLPHDFSPQLVSEALCSRAKAVSEDSRAVSSPFQQRAMEEGLHYVGGKHDDISVVVAVVGDPSERLTRGGFSVRSGPDTESGSFSTESHGAGQLSA
ncbi:uncharacterized protein PSANT_02199 [Moesziomyces antarcticus]|nr:uncharacterized protein PSANT_02199 [Moesziomyces antarcticus]